jgi:hypothetical protein
VPDGDGRQPQLVGHRLRESVPLVARPFLQVRPLFEPEPPHLAADAQLPAELEDELGVLARFLAAQAVIHVQHSRLTPQPDERPQQRHRVRPARDQRQRASQLHAVTLRRTPHGNQEIVSLHANSLKNRAAKWCSSITP